MCRKLTCSEGRTVSATGPGVGAIVVLLLLLLLPQRGLVWVAESRGRAGGAGGLGGDLPELGGERGGRHGVAGPGGLDARGGPAGRLGEGVPGGAGGGGVQGGHGTGFAGEHVDEMLVLDRVDAERPRHAPGRDVRVVLDVLGTQALPRLPGHEFRNHIIDAEC